MEIELTFSHSEILEKLVCYSNSFEYFSIHTSNKQASKHSLIAGFGAKKTINSLNQISLIDDKFKFGFVSYDYKNAIEELKSQHNNNHQLPDISFFVPEIIIKINGNKLQISADTIAQEEEIAKQVLTSVYHQQKHDAIFLQARTNKEEYLNAVKKLKQRIQLGDIYEINYCINFYNNTIEADTNTIFLQLNNISEAPFACYTRHKDIVIISSSPERFIQKEGNHLSTEPIKGTAARGKSEAEENLIKQELQSNKKERNENVMIVDVSRNDLSRVATKGSVKVDELFKVKTYKQVHQLVSTVSCQLKEDITLSSIFDSTFPPASMTGAPKIKAMQLIDEHENFRRGAYAGSIGFIEPNGDFDFNVVIRSIIYNHINKHISYSVGSAITAKCEAEYEYEKCMLKAKAMKAILENK